MAAKVIQKFDILPKEKERLDAICKSLNITKIEFLRQAMREAESKIELEERRN